MSTILVVSEFNPIKGIVKNVLKDLDFVKNINLIGIKQIDSKSKLDMWSNLKYDLIIFDLDSIMTSPVVIFDRYTKVSGGKFWGGVAPKTLVLSTDKQISYMGTKFQKQNTSIIYKPFTISQFICAVNLILSK